MTVAFSGSIDLLWKRRSRSQRNAVDDRGRMEQEAENKEWYTRRRKDKWSAEDLAKIPADWRPVAGETLDLILRKKVFLLQSRRGYRANTDSQVLAYFALRRREEAGQRHGEAPSVASHAFFATRRFMLKAVPVEIGLAREEVQLLPHSALDLGAGNGLVSVLYGLANTNATIEMLELQEVLGARAERNMGLNMLDSRSNMTLHDLAYGLPNSHLGKFDVVLCNPPFHTDPTKRSPPSRTEKLLAHYESSAGLVEFAQAAKRALSLTSPLASAYFVHDAMYRDRVIESVKEAGLAIVAVQDVFHRSNLPPLRILIELKLNEPSSQSTIELDPLVLHPEGTSEVEYGEDMEDFLSSLPQPQYKIGQLRDDYEPINAGPDREQEEV